MLRIIFNLPMIIWNWIKPINSYTYQPSNEWQRKNSEKMRNTARLIEYRAKKSLKV